MEKRIRFTIILVLILIVVIAFSFQSKEKKEYLVYNEALDKTAVTVDDAQKSSWSENGLKSLSPLSVVCSKFVADL